MRLRIFAISTILLAFALPINADDPASPTDPSEAARTVESSLREDVIVSATRTERNAADVPVSTSILTNEQIATAPAHTTDDLLRAIPGLNLPATSSSVLFPTSDTVSMRGLGGNRALVLVDGVPLNDPLSGYIPWQRIPPQSIERVEVVRGGAASLFGNFAMGGVVNILTAPADRDRVSAEASAGSYGTRQVSASVTRLLSGSTGLGVDAETFDSDGYFRTPASIRGAIDTPFWSRARNFGIRIDHSTDSGTSTFARASYSRSVLSNGTRLSGDDRNAIDLSGGLRNPNVFGGEIALTAFGERQEFDNQNTSILNGDRDVEFLSNRHQTPIRSLGGALQWTRPISTSVPLIVLGLDANRLQAEDHGEIFGTPGELTSRRNSGGRQDFGGLFAEVDFFPNPRLELLASARLDAWRNFDGKQAVHPGSTLEYKADHATQLDPRIALRFDLGSGFALRGAVYRAFRAPTLNDLYRSTQSKGVQILGNPTLGPESLVGGEVGAEVSGGFGNAQLNVFTNAVRDLISQVPVSSAPTLVLRNLNVGRSESRGVELFGHVAISRILSIDAAATYTRSIVTDNPPDRSLEGRLVPLVPERFASVGIRCAAPAGWVATLRARAQSLRYQDASNQTRLDPFALFDLFVARSLGSGIEINASVENLLDRRYVSDALVEPRFGAPRQFFGGVRFHPDLSGSNRSRTQK